MKQATRLPLWPKDKLPQIQCFIPKDYINYHENEIFYKNIQEYIKDYDNVDKVFDRDQHRHRYLEPLALNIDSDSSEESDIKVLSDPDEDTHTRRTSLPKYSITVRRAIKVRVNEPYHYVDGDKIIIQHEYNSSLTTITHEQTRRAIRLSQECQFDVTNDEIPNRITYVQSSEDEIDEEDDSQMINID